MAPRRGPVGDRRLHRHPNQQRRPGGAGGAAPPGPAEEAIASKLPMLGKLAKPLARMGGAEAVNEAQGGPVGAGALGAAEGVKITEPLSIES